MKKYNLPARPYPYAWLDIYFDPAQLLLDMFSTAEKELGHLARPPELHGCSLFTLARTSSRLCACAVTLLLPDTQGSYKIRVWSYATLIYNYKTQHL
jgi:hypothetical protein